MSPGKISYKEEDDSRVRAILEDHTSETSQPFRQTDLAQWCKQAKLAQVPSCAGEFFETRFELVYRVADALHELWGEPSFLNCPERKLMLEFPFAVLNRGFDPLIGCV